MVLAAYGYVEERGSGSPSTSRPWPVTSSEWSGHGWTGCWSHRLPWPLSPPLHDPAGDAANPVIPTRTGYGAPQLPHRPQHKPRTEQPNPSPNRPHAAEPTRKALVTKESLLAKSAGVSSFLGSIRAKCAPTLFRQMHTSGKTCRRYLVALEVSPPLTSQPTSFT